MKHASETGLAPSGENNGMAKLTKEEVEEMRSRFDPDKHRYRDIAKEYGISGTQAWRIITGKLWSQD